MGKGASVLLVTLTCVALLPRCHSQGEVRVTECIKDAPFSNLLLGMFTHRVSQVTLSCMLRNLTSVLIMFTIVLYN